MTTSLFVNTFLEGDIHGLVPFPGFDEETLPLLLVNEGCFFIILNIKTRKYTKVIEVETSNSSVFYFLNYDKVIFITKYNYESLAAVVIPTYLVEFSLRS